MTRRELLDAALALMVLPAVVEAAPPRKEAEVPRRKLGKTGELVSCIGVGGAHLGGQATEKETVAIVRRAVDEGINFLDNSWDYHQGKSEELMGKALRDGYRQRAFLMTKFDGRDAKTATKQIDESLRRLQTDRVDLLQLHEVIHADDAARVFAEGGAIEAMLAAKKAGKARFLGFTGHKSPRLHLEMLAAAKQHGFHFDTVQLPLNVMDAHYESFEKQVVPVLLKEGIAVLGMKSMGSPFILQTRTVTAPECLRYSLSLPTSVVITGMDSMPRVEQALAVARGFKPYTEAEVNALLAKTKAAAKDGAAERYKTTRHFDATAQHPEWLG